MTGRAEDYAFPPRLEELIVDVDTIMRCTDLEAIERAEAAVVPVNFSDTRLKLTVNIIVDKRATRLFVVNVFGDTLMSFPVCCSRNLGQKKARGDCRTPEGTFGVLGVYNSTDWRYQGTGAKCYGPYFIHLNTPSSSGIGIHGTNAPGSVPGRHSHGCMRLHNDDIRKLRTVVTKETRVTILPDDAAAARREMEAIRAAYAPPTRKIHR